jgi:hypothetical protein
MPLPTKPRCTHTSAAGHRGDALVQLRGPNGAKVVSDVGPRRHPSKVHDLLVTPRGGLVAPRDKGIGASLAQSDASVATRVRHEAS